MKKIILIMTILLSAVGMQARVHHMEANLGPRHSVVCRTVVNDKHGVKVYKVKHSHRGWRHHRGMQEKKKVKEKRVVRY